jgi:heme exporter protein D
MNWSQFFAMGGYGLYVWFSYGAAVLVLVYNILAAFHRVKSVHKQFEELARLSRAGNE